MMLRKPNLDFILSEAYQGTKDAKSLIGGLLTAIGILSVVGFTFETNVLRWLMLDVFDSAAAHISTATKSIGLSASETYIKLILIYYLALVANLRGTMMKFPELDESLCNAATLIYLVLGVVASVLFLITPVPNATEPDSSYSIWLLPVLGIVALGIPAFILHGIIKEIIVAILSLSKYTLFAIFSPLIGIILIRLAYLPAMITASIRESVNLMPVVIFWMWVTITIMWVALMLAICLFAPIIRLVIHRPRVLFGTLYVVLLLLSLDFIVRYTGN